MLDDSEQLSNITKIQPYLVKDIKRPKLRIETKVYSNLIKSYIFTRKLSFFKKQVIVFNTYKNNETYSEEFIKYCANFVQVLNTFIDKESKCGNMNYIKNMITQFDTLSIYSIPTLMYYIENLFSQNGQFHNRFKSAILYLEHIHSKELIDTIKINNLKMISQSTDTYVTPLATSSNVVLVQKDISTVHNFLDMCLYAPWMYVFYVYKFISFSLDQSIGKLEI